MVKYTNERIMQLLKLYIKRLNKKFKLEKVILFGSRARGDYLINSDIDLIVVSKDFESIPFRKRMSEAIEDWSGEIDIEVLCYTPEEFKRKMKEIGIINIAVKEGIKILEKSHRK